MLNISAKILFLFFSTGLLFFVISAFEPEIRLDSRLRGSDKLFERSLNLGFDQPVRISIPRISVDTKVVEAPIENGYWEVAPDAANHGQGSAYPGETGNTVLFAHARLGLFANLKKIQLHDLISIYTTDGQFVYQVEDISSVTPDRLDVIAPSSDERLTLFTCSGNFDEKRLVVVAKPIKNLLGLAK